MHQTTTRQPKIGATRQACGHLACAGHTTCRYIPGTYTIRVDYCVGETCCHCHPEEASS